MAMSAPTLKRALTARAASRGVPAMAAQAVMTEMMSECGHAIGAESDTNKKYPCYVFQTSGESVHVVQGLLYQ